MVRVDFKVMFDQLRSDADDFLVHVTKHGYHGLKPLEVYTIADNILSLVFFFPFVVLFCQSTDAILDVLVCNNFPIIGPCLILLLGITIEFGCSFYQTTISQTILGADNSEIDNNFNKKQESSNAHQTHESKDGTHKNEVEVFHMLSTRTFNYILAVANVCHYRGVYDVFVIIEGHGMRAGTAAALTGIVGLWGLRASRNMIGSPLCVATDNVNAKKFFKVDTLLNYQVIHSIADCLVYLYSCNY